MEVFQIIVFLFVAFIVIKELVTYINDKNLPVVSARARLIEKKRDINAHAHVNGVITNIEALILIFELDTDNHIKVTVGESIFRAVPEHEWGTLTFRGTHFLKFESASWCIE